MQKTIRVGKCHAEIRELENGLFVKIIEYPECTAMFKKEEFHNIQDTMRAALVRYLIETGQTGLKKFDAKVRKRLEEDRLVQARKKRQRN